MCPTVEDAVFKELVWFDLFSLRNILKNLLDLYQKEAVEETRQLKVNRAIQLARKFP